MCPSCPGFPVGRQSAQREAPTRTGESFDWYETITATVPAGAVFSEVAVFSGRPDTVTIRTFGANVQVRLKQRGRAPGTPTEMISGEPIDFKVAAEIVEARDNTGAGGQDFVAIGRYLTSGIDVRMNYGGPSRERPTGPDEDRYTQILTSE